MNKTQLIHNPRLITKFYRVIGVLVLAFSLAFPAAALENAKTETGPPEKTPAMEPNSGANLADQAGEDFKGGAKNLGSGFKKGTKVTGRAFKKAGLTMGRAFKKAGIAIKEFFAGKKDSEVEERDLSGNAAQEETGKTVPIQYDHSLDSVGDG